MFGCRRWKGATDSCQDPHVSLKSFFSQLLPNVYCCVEVHPDRYRTPHLPFMNLMRFLDCFCSLPTFLWITVLPSNVAVVAINGTVLWVYSVLLSRLLMKLLNSFGPGMLEGFCQYLIASRMLYCWSQPFGPTNFSCFSPTS